MTAEMHTLFEWIYAHAFEIVALYLLWRIARSLHVLRDSRITPQTFEDYFMRKPFRDSR